jgi:hypothetical protein
LQSLDILGKRLLLLGDRHHGACSGLMIYNLLIAPLSLNPGNWLMDRAAVRHDTGSLVLVFVA